MKKYIRSLSFVMAVVLVGALCVFAVPASAANEINTTLNLLNVRKNERGEGWYWHNPSKTLTVTNMHIATDDTYGIRVPNGVTVVLEGNNVISADIAFSCEGSIYIKGTGTLNLVGKTYAFENAADEKTHAVRMLEGNLVIVSDGIGISSPRAEFSQTGGAIRIDAKGDAVYGRKLSFLGGKLIANNTVHAISALTASYCAMDITAPEGKTALLSDKEYDLHGLKLPKEYEGESWYGSQTFSCTAASKRRTTSMLYGDSVSVVFDYITVIAAVAIVAAIIVVPQVRRKKRLKAAIEKYQEEEKQRQIEKAKSKI